MWRKIGGLAQFECTFTLVNTQQTTGQVMTGLWPGCGVGRAERESLPTTTAQAWDQTVSLFGSVLRAIAITHPALVAPRLVCLLVIYIAISRELKVPFHNFFSLKYMKKYV